MTGPSAALAIVNAIATLERVAGVLAELDRPAESDRCTLAVAELRQTLVEALELDEDELVI